MAKISHTVVIVRQTTSQPLPSLFLIVMQTARVYTLTVILEIKLFTKKKSRRLLLKEYRQPPVHLLQLQATQKPHFKGKTSEKRCKRQKDS